MNENNLFCLITDKITEPSKFFCLKLISFLDKEFLRGDRLYKFHYIYDFKLASQGKCRFKAQCPIYKKTLRKNTQLKLF